MKVTLVICTIFALAALTSAYLVSPQQMDFYKGIIYCKKNKLRLILPRNEIDARKLYKFVATSRRLIPSDTGVVRTWLFGTKKKDKWIDNLGHELSPKFNNTYYGSGEPNNNLNHERCLELRILDKNDGTHYWNDAPCIRKNYVICEEP